MKKLLLSFKYAFGGIFFCIKTCRNFRIHMVAASYALFFIRFCSNDIFIYSLVLAICALVLSLEAVNCALEQLCNAYTSKYNKFIKYAKDAAAGAVLIAALAAAAVGIMLFFQKSVLSEIYAYFSASLLRTALLILSVIVSILFIFFKDIFKNGKKRN